METHTDTLIDTTHTWESMGEPCIDDNLSSGLDRFLYLGLFDYTIDSKCFLDQVESLCLYYTVNTAAFSVDHLSIDLIQKRGKYCLKCSSILFFFCFISTTGTTMHL